MKTLLLILSIFLFVSCSKTDTYCYAFYELDGTKVAETCGVTPADAYKFGKQNNYVVVKL